MSVVLVILKIIGWVFAGIFGLFFFLILLTAVPIRYKLIAHAGSDNHLTIRASYLLKLVRVIYKYKKGKSKTEIYIAFFKMGGKIKTRDKKQPEEKTPEKKSAEKKARGKKTNILTALTEMQVKIIIKHTVSALKKICRALRPKYFKISGIVGFSDPFKTGIFLGAYEALAGMFRLKEKVQIIGDFNNEKINIRTEVRGKINIFRVSLPILWLITRKPVFALILKMWRKGD